MSIAGSSEPSGKSRVATKGETENLEYTYRTLSALLCERDFASRMRGRYRISSLKVMAETLLLQLKGYVADHPTWLTKDDSPAAEMFDACLEAVDYYDDLALPKHAWLQTVFKSYYQEIATGEYKLGKTLTRQFHLALLHLSVEWRSRRLDHKSLEHEFVAVESLLEKLYESNTAESYRLLARYYHMRAQLGRQSPLRFEADRFIDLASSCGDMEQRFSRNQPDEMLVRKLLPMGLTKIWIQIAKGCYTHALELLRLVRECLLEYDKDLLTYAKYLMALSICHRALAGKHVGQLRRVIKQLNESLDIFNELGDGRHLLRCYYERSLCFLLVKDYEKVSEDLRFMQTFASVDRQTYSIGWHVQSLIMASRLACERGEYAAAEKNANQALTSAKEADLELLNIEARNTLAMVLFRQDRLPSAEGHLTEALRLNHDGLQQTEHGDLSQPALYGISVLYLSRVRLLNNDLIGALRWLQEWRRIRNHIQHKWVTTLGEEVEDQALQYCLLEHPAMMSESLDFSKQLQLLRKTAIERANRQLRSKKIVDIARELKVNRQTVHYWLKELKEANIVVNLK